jgi:signal transduction histidine kinase
MTSELERQLSRLGRGEHLCPIHETLAEEMASAVFFMKLGLARGECCSYIANDQTVEKVFQMFAATGVNVAHECARGALQSFTTRETFQSAGEFNPQAMIDFLQRAESGALAAGFSGSRVIVAEKSWTIGPQLTCERLVEYEVRLHQIMPNSRTVLICQYNRESFGPAIIHDVLLTHRLVILGERVCPNPFYEPPDLVLRGPAQPSAELLARRVDWRIHQLKEARRGAQEREQILERLQALSRRLLEVQEEERRHLARELHDEVGQMLTGMGLILKTNGALTADAARAGFEKAQTLVDELLERVRQLSFDLRPAALDQLGLLPGLLALFERYTRQTGVLVDFKHQGVDGRFAPEVETTAYRIVQEALTNVARHAGVAGVTVRAWTTKDMLSVQIEDRGHGFDLEAVLATPRSSGLVGMQERATLQGGRLTIESRPGAGTQITAELPLSGAGEEP